jgi:hypothetical protein
MKQSREQAAKDWDMENRVLVAMVFGCGFGSLVFPHMAYATLALAAFYVSELIVVSSILDDLENEGE